MTLIDAIILGIIQGLTEFLPVSSSGHIELGKVILGAKLEDNLTFSIFVHGATVLSTIVIFRKDILELITGLFKFRWNEETRFITMILASMIPVTLLYFAIGDQLEALFEGRVVLVGSMLMITALLLWLTTLAKPGEKGINLKSAILIGIAQAIAVLPGISRSGATISTALYLSTDKSKATRFAFLMVLPPIIGATAMEVKKLYSAEASGQASLDLIPLVAGFIAAFLAGLIACKWMINIVKKGKISYFAIYCAVIGLAAILWGWLA